MHQQAVTTDTCQFFEPLLTTEETAVHLRCHLKTVQKMAREGRIPSIRRGKRHFFRLSEVNQWLCNMHTRPSATVN